MLSSYIPKLQSNTIEDLVLSTPPSQHGLLEDFLAALRANTSLRSVFFFDGINPSSYFYLVLQNLSNHSRLTNLRILGPGQPFDLLHLVQLLQNNLQLQLLVLQSCSIGDEEVKCIVEALSGHHRLTSINLSKNHITDLGSKYLIDFLTAKPSITSIDLSFNHQVDNTAVAHWARLLRQSTSLNNLNLNNNNLGDKAFELLGEALASNAYLKTIGLCDIGGDYGDNDIPTFLQALGTNSSLTSLDLSYNKLRQDDIVLLAETLRANKTLTELNLAGTSLDDKDIKVLTDGLKFNRTLHVLNLDSNNFAGEGLQALALFLRTKWCSLKSLSLAEIQDAEINEGIGNLATALRTNTSLTFLKINNDKCDFKQFSALMDALRTNTTLLTLDISNFVSLAQKDEIMLVAESLAANKTLTDINLDTTGINDAGVGLLCSVARDHCSLRHISLHYNMITEAGAKLLLLTMRLNSKISFEGIVMNPYIDGDFRKEYEEIHHCFKNKKHALTNPHFTPFHFAAKKGIFSAFQNLFGKTENPNMTCTYGLSLLDYAGIYGHAAIVNLLLNFGAYTRDAILLGVDRLQITSANRAENGLFTLDDLCAQMDAVLQRPLTAATRLKMIKWHRAGSLLLSLWQRCKLSPGLNEICTRHAVYELGKRLRMNEMLPSLQQRYQFYRGQAGELVVKRYFDGPLPPHIQAGLTPHFASLLMNKWNKSVLASVDLARHFEGAYQGVVFHMWWVNQFPPPFNEAIEAKVVAAIISLAQRMSEAPQFLRQIMQQRSSTMPPGSPAELIAGSVLTELRTRYRDGQLSVEERALFEREVLYPILQSTAGLNEALLELRHHAVSHVLAVALQQPQAHAALILALVQELAVDVVEMSLMPHADHVADLIHEQALVLMLKDWRFNKFTSRESQVMQECTLPQLSSRVVQLRRKIFPSLIDLSVQYLRFINFEEEQSSAREILIQSLDKVHNIDDLARVLNAHPDYEGILSDEVKDEIQKQLNFSQQLNSHPLVKQLLRENNELKKRLEGNTRMMRIDSMDSMSERVEEMTDANF